MSTPHSDPLVSHTDSNEAAALLRRNLTGIAEQHRDAPLARHIREVLDGRRDLADLERDDDFMRVVRSGVRQYEDHVASLSAEEKEHLYAQAREIAEREDGTAT